MNRNMYLTSQCTYAPMLDRITHQMKKLGYNVEQLSAISGDPADEVEQFLSGNKQIVTYPFLRGLATALKMSISDLIGY